MSSPKWYKDEPTCFQKIAQFNELIGNKKGNSAYLMQQFQMIREEFEELEKALVAYDKLENGGWPEQGSEAMYEHLEKRAAALIEVRDGMADVVVTVGGLAHRLNVDIDGDLEEVYQSNMSKFIKLPVPIDLKPELDYLCNKLGIAVEAVETAPGIIAFRSVKDSVGLDGKQYPQGKLLKPSTYREPKFCPF